MKGYTPRTNLDLDGQTQTNNWNFSWASQNLGGLFLNFGLASQKYSLNFVTFQKVNQKLKYLKGVRF